jgi:hypothetical protein
MLWQHSGGLVGPEDWFHRDIKPIDNPWDICDFPGHFHEIVECLQCEAEFEGIRRSRPEVMICPFCRSMGVQVIRQIRKIYLQ